MTSAPVMDLEQEANSVIANSLSAFPARYAELYGLEALSNNGISSDMEQLLCLEDEPPLEFIVS